VIATSPTYTRGVDSTVGSTVASAPGSAVASAVGSAVPSAGGIATDLGAPTGPSARPLRADAERNRRLILDVAARVFAERGLGATLNDIAHEAGVGVGTVYRRFADKDAVIDALFDVKFSVLVDLARAAHDAPTAGDGLRTFLWGAAEARARDRGLAQVLAGARGPREEANRKREMLHELVADLVARAQAEGSVRPDVAASDVPMFMLMIGAVADGTRGVADDVWQRYARLLIDSLAPAPAPTSSPVPSASLAPPTGEALDPPPLRLDQVYAALQRHTA
jgi:AcrR family transcriptional regulator